MVSGGQLYLSTGGPGGVLFTVVQRGVQEFGKAVAEMPHHTSRVGLDVLVDSDAELHCAGVAEYAQTDADIAALGHPEHRLGELCSRQIYRFFWARHVSEYRRGLIAEHGERPPLKDIRAAPEQVQQAVGYLSLIGAFEAVHVFLNLAEPHDRIGLLHGQGDQHQPELVAQGFDRLSHRAQVKRYGNANTAFRRGLAGG